MSRCSVATAAGARLHRADGRKPDRRGSACRHPHPIDRHMTATALGFREPTRNRSTPFRIAIFALEFLAIAAITATHLSRLAEEIVICRRRNSASSACRTPSPPARRSCRKREPRCRRTGAGQDRPHQWRADRAAHGDEGLPLAYSKDMQEDKNRSSMPAPISNWRLPP